jgi:four helix bundle protein
MTENRGQKTEDRRQRTEDRGQKTEDRKQRTEDRERMNDSIGSSEETRGWLDFAKDCMHITKNKHDKLDNGYDQVNAMLYSLMNNWQTFSNS